MTGASLAVIPRPPIASGAGFDRGIQIYPQTSLDAPVKPGHDGVGRRPARATVGVTALAVGALVEIDMIARRPEEGS